MPWTYLLVALIGLFYHLRWIAIDPSNPAEGTGYVPAAALAMGIMMLILVGAGAPEPLKAQLAHFALGLALGPAFVAPLRLRRDEEPSFVRRWFSGKRNQLGGAAQKAILIPACIWLAAALNVPSPEYTVPVTLAVIFSFGRGLKAVEYETDKLTLKADYAKAFPRGVAGAGWTGLVGLILFAGILHPYFELVTPPQTSLIALVLGMSVRVVFDI